MFIDYILTKGNVFIDHLYDGSKANKHYYYHKGCNIQGIIAYICGIALPFPGFVGTLGPHVSNSATDLSRLGWLLSFVVSFVVYFAICSVWPTRNQVMIREMGLGWEEQSEDTVSGDRTMSAGSDEDGNVNKVNVAREDMEK
jgi:NCS1 family nucleobase:cation symporter-1